MPFDQSSYFYDSSPIVASDAQVTWSGESIPCLEICKGDRLATTNAIFAATLCQLLGDVDITEATIPACLASAWGTQDKNILNAVNILMAELCSLDSRVDTLETNEVTLSTEITLDYACCEDSCNTGNTLTIPEHFVRIIECLCAQKARIDELEGEVKTLNDNVTNLSSSVTTLSTTVSELSADMVKIKICMPDCF